MFTNGSTAIECGGGLNAEAAGGADFGIQGFWMNRYAAPAAITTASANQRGLARDNFPGATAADARACGELTPARSCTMRRTNSGGVSPAGRRVHWTSRNLSGTFSSSSAV